MIFDTDVLIWLLRGNEKAINAVKNAIPFAISIVTYMELVRGMRNKQELEQMKKAFEKMDVEVIQINESISRRASEYVERFYLSDSVEMADALIASTCVELNQTLYTANDKHYKAIEDLHMDVFRP